MKSQIRKKYGNKITENGKINIKGLGEPCKKQKDFALNAQIQL